MAAAGRALPRALGCAAALGQASLPSGAGGMPFGRPGGCAALQARRCSSPPPDESPEDEGPGVGGGGVNNDLNARVARLRVDVDTLTVGQKGIKEQVQKLVVGDTAFHKDIKEQVQKLMVGDTAFQKAQSDAMDKKFKDITEQVQKLVVGDTAFQKAQSDAMDKKFKELRDDMNGVLRWQQRVLGVAGTASLLAVYALRHLIVGT